jgi:hypothetical protein
MKYIKKIHKYTYFFLSVIIRDTQFIIETVIIGIFDNKMDNETSQPSQDAPITPFSASTSIPESPKSPSTENNYDNNNQSENNNNLSTNTNTKKDGRIAREYSLEDKYKMVTEDLSQRKLAAKYGVSYGWINSLLKRKDEIIYEYENGSSSSAVDSKEYNTTLIEQKVLEYYLELREKGSEVTGPLLKKRALDVALELGALSFNATNSWLDKFKLRHSIKLKEQSAAEDERIKDLIAKKQEKLEKSLRRKPINYNEDSNDQEEVDENYINSDSEFDISEDDPEDIDYNSGVDVVEKSTTRRKLRPAVKRKKKYSTPSPPFKNSNNHNNKKKRNSRQNEDNDDESVIEGDDDPKVGFFQANLAVNKLINFFTQQSNAELVKKLYYVRTKIQKMEEDRNLKGIMKF